MLRRNPTGTRGLEGAGAGSAKRDPVEVAAQFVASRVNAKLVPPELLAFCRERAGGHPLFLEELLKELVDSGAVSTVAGGSARPARRAPSARA